MRLWVTATVLLLTGGLSAQVPAGDRFHQAIRTDDLSAALHTIQREAGGFTMPPRQSHER